MLATILILMVLIGLVSPGLLARPQTYVVILIIHFILHGPELNVKWRENVTTNFQGYKSPESPALHQQHDYRSSGDMANEINIDETISKPADIVRPDRSEL